MNDGKRSTVFYFNSDVPVLPGDRVVRKGWFRRRKAEIVYVPGVSEMNSWFHESYDDSDITSCGVRFESGSIIGEVVYPDSHYLRETIHFIERGQPSQCDLSGLDEE